MRLVVQRKVKQRVMFAGLFMLLAVSVFFAGQAFIKPAFAADPAISGGAPIVGLTDVYIPVTGVEVTGDVVGTTTVSARVGSGSLRMTTTTGLTFQGATTGRTLVFDGTKEDLNAALATLQYRANEPGSVDLTVTLGAPGIVYYPGNGHIYEVVTVDGGISWEDARVAAEQRTMNGAQGYLATITEQNENDYITARLVGDGWFGANDISVENEWRWVTGPEAGTLFWQGRSDGTLQSGQFANWADGIEPNDYGSGEDCAQFYGDGSGWNDLPCSGHTLNSYVVEYGAPGNMPIVPSEVTVSTSTTTPEPQTVSLSTCEQFFDEYVNSNEHRYDDITLTQDLDCEGETISALFSEVEYVYDPDEGQEVARPIAFRGTFNGNGHTISNLSIAPTLNTQGNYLPNGLFGATDDGVVIENLTLQGVTVRGQECVGGVVGSARSITLRNVDFNGTVELAGSWGYGVGGLVGCLSSEGGNSTVTNSTVSGTVGSSADEGEQVGGLIGSVSIDSSTSSSDISITNNAVTTTVMGNGRVGGLVGYVYVYSDGGSVTITDNATVAPMANGSTLGGALADVSIDRGSLEMARIQLTGDISGYQYVGGLIGQLYSYGQVNLHDLTLESSVSAQDSYAGGLIAYAYQHSSELDGLSIQNVTTSGAVTSRYYAGGLVGYLYGYNQFDSNSQATTVYQSRASGQVATTDGYYAGGLVGSAYGAVIDQSYATGNISVPNDETAGGLVGYMNRSVIQDSYARGNVESKWGRTGGLVGTVSSYNTITNSYSTGKVSATEPDAVYKGGLIGDFNIDENNSVVSSYWDTTASEMIDSPQGTGKPSEAMKVQPTFIGWDFDATWATTQSQNDGYPCLQWTSGCINEPDQDQVSEAVEQAAPNSGDGNGDGIQDSEQSNVTSVLSPASGTYVTLESTCASNYNVQVGGEPTVAGDDEYDYPAGLVGFTLLCGTPGVTSTVTQYYYGNYSLSDMVLRKQMADGSYITLNDAVLSQVTIGGQSAIKVVYTITDGSAYDDDGIADGNIVDPVGIAYLPGSVGAPNTGLQGADSSVGILLALVGAVSLATFAWRLTNKLQ